MNTQRTALVTGASSGIGLLIASKLHDNGFIVFGTSRYPDKYRDKVAFELLELDLTSDASIAQCIDTVFSKTKTLDILVNNAGVMIGGSIEETLITDAYRQLEISFWGAVKITKAVLPFMRIRRSGQIIAIGSLAGRIGVPLQSSYSAAKHATEGFFKSLRFEVRQFNIKVSVVEPGFFRTNIDTSSELAKACIPDYDHFRKNVFRFLDDSMARSTTSEPVADLVLKIVNSKNPKYNYPIGKNSVFLPFLQFFCYRLFEKGFSRKAKM